MFSGLHCQLRFVSFERPAIELAKLENSLPSEKESLCSQEHFDMWVDRLKVSLARSGVRVDGLGSKGIRLRASEDAA